MIHFKNNRNICLFCKDSTNNRNISHKQTHKKYQILLVIKNHKIPIITGPHKVQDKRNKQPFVIFEMEITGQCGHVGIYSGYHYQHYHDQIWLFRPHFPCPALYIEFYTWSCFQTNVNTLTFKRDFCINIRMQYNVNLCILMKGFRYTVLTGRVYGT